ncbi:MAG: DinB family protein [Leeuwenhoekiella sp.]
MTNSKVRPEVWLRGPLPEIPALLQPAAHALLQTLEELYKWLDGFPDEKLWVKPAGRASVGFHLQHITGVLDRMLTYAKGEKLTEEQFAYLEAEGQSTRELKCELLINNFKIKVTEATNYFKSINEKTMTDYRSVGRKELPSTVIGLLFHAAEHSQRHLGQLLVTASILTENENP